MKRRDPYFLIPIKVKVFLVLICCWVTLPAIASEWIQGFSLKQIGSEQSIQKAHSFKMEFDSVELLPKQGIVIDLPGEFKNRTIDQVVLVHRQSPYTDKSSVRSYKDEDATPGYTSLLFLDESFPEGQKWRYWNGPSSKSWGGKFAEVRKRSAPEEELLYAFNHYGTRSLTGFSSKQPLKASQIAIVSNGKDPVYLHRIDIKYLPSEPIRYIERVYSPKTVFDSFAAGRMKSFGGGERYYGQYPQAWRLNEHGSKKIYTHATSVSASGRELRIALPKGMKISALDIACGDATGWDGSRYIPGNSKLTVTWIRDNVVLQNLLSNENVGAQSMLRALPERSEEVTKDGDTLEIKAAGDTAFIMGFRLGLF